MSILKSTIYYQLINQVFKLIIPGYYSCVNQLLSIVHDIYAAFDAYPTLESHDVFLDMSKAFDEVWHEGLIFKLKSMEISNTLLELIKSFLKNRFQRVILNGQMSEWLPQGGLPQGFVLGPLFFPNLYSWPLKWYSIYC